MKRTVKKLVLAKETVRDLVGGDLAAAQGGLTQAMPTRACGRAQLDLLDSPWQNKAIADSRRIC
jgi:hypothetical protein